jgi:hypothetical protein
MISVGANAELAMTAKTRLGVGPNFNRVEFAQIGFTDSNIFTVPVDLYYGITPKTDLSVGYAYTHTTTADGSGDSTGNFVNVGARGQFTEKLSGQVRVGVTENRPKAGQSVSQLGVESTLNYAFSPRTTFSLYANNGFAPSAAGNQTEVFSTGLSGNFQLSQAWSASITGGLSATKYLIIPSRTDHFYDVSASLNYIVTSYLNLQASYLYRKNVSNIQSVTFDDNLATLTAACRF